MDSIMDEVGIVFKEESYLIIGACMKVHSALGAGFLEAVYHEALETEFKKQNIPYKKEVSLDLYYDGQRLKKTYRADFICYDEIIIEMKAVSFMPKVFYTQVRNYLKATNYRLGLLVNFGEASLKYKRILNRPNSH